MSSREARLGWRVTCGVSLLVLCLFASAESAQSTGDIAGIVTDTSGAVLPGVVVTLAGPALLQPQTFVTANSGTYRFPRLDVGRYTLTFELAGFNTVIREDIKIEIGFAATVNATLEMSPVKETITVKGDSPIVDRRETSRSARFTRDALDRVPTARDPWAMLAQTPGVLMAAVNVGGNLAGQQSGTASRGDWNWNNTWTLDGVEITDAAASGASSIFFDFDSFEQVQVTTGGGASQQTSGVGVHLVTRSGSDLFRGSARLFVTDDSLASQNVDDGLRRQGAGAGNPIRNVSDGGVEAGGPLRLGRAWIWGAYGRQDVEVGVLNFYKKTGACAGLTGATAIGYPLETVRDCLQPNLTTVWSANLKAQVQLQPRNTLTWFTNVTEKVSPNRGASDRRPVETTWRQAAAPSAHGPRLWKTGPTTLWKIGDRHVVNDRWLIDVQWAHHGNNFAFDFADAALAAEQPRLEITTGEWSRSYLRSVYLRPVDSVTLVTESFHSSLAGGDHAIAAGWRWRSGSAYDESHWGGNTVARYRNGVPVDATLYRDSVTNDLFRTQAAWIQDTYSRRRLTITAGVRWDRQRDAAGASRVPAHPFDGQPTARGTAFDWLPAVAFGGADAGPAWNDLSPRVAVSHDAFGDGRTIVKAFAARYYAQRSAGWLSAAVNPVTEAMIRFPWSDANGDGRVQPQEIDASPTRILAFAGNYSPYDPGRLSADNRVDPRIRNYRTDEIVVGIDRQVGPEFAAGAAYTWRRHAQTSMNAVAGLSSADYVRRSYTPSANECPEPGARCPAVEYWEPVVPLPATVLVTNRPDYERGYHGLELTARRRLRDRWMFDASVTFNDARQRYRTPRAYQDPTNIEMLDGAQFGVDATTAGNLGVTPIPNARWTAKLSGAYTLPWWDIGLAGFYQARQGYPFLQQVLTPPRSNSAGNTIVLLDPVGKVRYPALHLADLGVSKTVSAGPLTLTAILDVFNVANANTVLARQLIQNGARANQVSTIVAPRVVRLGLRVGW